MRKIFSILVCIVFIFNMSYSFSFGETSVITQKDVDDGLLFCREYPVIVQIKGEAVLTGEKEVPPVIVGSRTLIPVKAFFEAMGATVIWNGDNRTVTVQNNKTKVELIIDSNITKVDGQEKYLDVPAMIIDHDEDGFGSTMVPLRFVSEGLGCKVAWSEMTRTADIVAFAGDNAGGDNAGSGSNGENSNGTGVTGENTPLFDTVCGKLNTLNDNAKKRLIAIDIGHGGKDTGAIAKEDTPDELYEKDVNLEVGLKLKELLDKAGANYIFTRETDQYLQLYDRPKLANERQADIFISLHNNSSEYNKPYGTEVYYYSKINADGIDEFSQYGIYSKNLAALVQKEMVAVLGTADRGAKESPMLAVLNKTSMPAIIVEGAFLSNEEDLAKIRTPEYKEKYAYAVAKGLIAAMNQAY